MIMIYNRDNYYNNKMQYYYNNYNNSKNNYRIYLNMLLKWISNKIKNKNKYNSNNRIKMIKLIYRNHLVHWKILHYILKYKHYNL